MGVIVTRPYVWERWKRLHWMVLLAAFEDSAGGTRVQEFSQALARDLGSQCRIVEHIWPFSTLRLRELQEIAADEASASDLIVISAKRAFELPEEVKHWIDLWPRPTGRRQAVLIALLDHDYEGASTAVQSYLQKAAQKGGMEFLVVSRDLPD